MSEERGCYARLVRRFMPEDDAVTAGEYHRLVPEAPLPVLRPVRPVSVCVVCGGGFVARRYDQRFCGRPCRVWFHYGPGAKARKAAS